MKIIRVRKKYYLNKKEIIDDRLRKLYIPPAWTDVHVSTDATSYLQATGIDKNGKIQYIYHPLFVKLSTSDKFERLKEFCKKLPNFLKKIYSVKINDPEYELCLLFKIMHDTHMRVGNDTYDTYGLTTLEKRHVKINDNEITFDFIGKRNVRNVRSLKGPLVQELKPFISQKKSTDKIFSKTSYELNDFLRANMGSKFSCKDFRTYASNKLFIETLCSLNNPVPETLNQKKKIIRATFNKVAQELGHTETTSKNSYVMNRISDIYLENTNKFRKGTDAVKVIMSI